MYCGIVNKMPVWDKLSLRREFPHFAKGRTMRKTTALSNLNFIFTSNGFMVDVTENELTAKAMVWKERFDADRYAALYQFGFSEKEEWLTPSMQFLFRVSGAFIQSLTRLPELELVRENAGVCPDADTIDSPLRLHCKKRVVSTTARFLLLV